MSILSKIFKRQVEMYEFTYKNNKYYYTNSDKDVLFLSQIYTPKTLKRSAIASTQNESKSVVNLTTTKDFPISQLFQRLNPQQITLKIYSASRDNLNDYNKIFEGIVNSCIFSKVSATLEVKPYSLHTSRQICRFAFSTMCNHHVFDRGCKVIIEDYSVNTDIVDINSDGVTYVVSDAGGFEDGYYQNGVITLSNDDSRQIIAHSGNQITLMSPFEVSEVGENVKLSAGCDRTSKICKSKFNNFTNFLGFENVPDRNPYTDGV